MAYADAFERAKERARRADKMRAFYEPGFFGAQTSSYDDPLGFSREVRQDPLPSTMGGFTYFKPSDAPPPLASQPSGAGSTLPPEVLARIQAEDRAKRTRTAYSAPPIGPQNLSNYGIGQLRNYGVGALAAYSPLASLRRR